MATSQVTLPKGFVLDQATSSGLPDGFVVDTQQLPPPNPNRISASEGTPPEGLWEKLKGHGKEFVEAFTKPSMAGPLISSGAALVRAGQDIVGPVVEPFVSEAIDNMTFGNRDRIMKSKPVQKTIGAVEKTAQKVKEKYPEAYRGASDIATVASVLPIGEGPSVAKNLVGESLGKAAGAAAGKLEKGLLKDVVEKIKPKFEALPTKDQESLMKSGKTSEHGLFKKTSVDTTAQHIDIAKSVQDVLKTTDTPSDQIKAIREKIGKYATETDNLPDMNLPRKVEGENGLGEKIARYKERDKPVFASDASEEKAYDDVVELFNDISKKHPETTQGLLQSRREFDNEMQRLFPHIFDQMTGDNVRAKALMNVRRAVNDHIEDILPKGNKYKELLHQQSNMYDAIDNIYLNRKAIPKNVLTRIADVAKSHPFITAEIGGMMIGAGSFGLGGMMSSILSNPAALGALSVYGTVRMGQYAITRPAFRKALIATLKSTERYLTTADKTALQGVIGEMREPPRALSPDRRPAVSTSPIPMPPKSGALVPVSGPRSIYPPPRPDFVSPKAGSVDIANRRLRPAQAEKGVRAMTPQQLIDSMVKTGAPPEQIGNAMKRAGYSAREITAYLKKLRRPQ